MIWEPRRISSEGNQDWLLFLCFRIPTQKALRDKIIWKSGPKSSWNCHSYFQPIINPNPTVFWPIFILVSFSLHLFVSLLWICSTKQVVKNRQSLMGDHFDSEKKHVNYMMIMRQTEDIKDVLSYDIEPDIQTFDWLKM